MPSGASAVSCCTADARAEELARNVATSFPPEVLNSVAHRCTRTPLAWAAETSAAPGSACGLETVPSVPTYTENAMMSVIRSQRNAFRSMLSQ